MTRKTIVTLLALTLLFIASSFASAATINSTTYTIADLGGDYFGANSTHQNFYAYHLSDTGVVSGYTLQYYTQGSSTYRYGYLAQYSGGAITMPFGTTSFNLAYHGVYQPSSVSSPVIYAPVMENSSGYWVYTDSSGNGHILNSIGTDITPAGWKGSNPYHYYYANAINSTGMVGGGDATQYYNNGGGIGELMVSGGTMLSPGPSGWVAAINDAGLAVTCGAGGFAAYVYNVSGSATTYWGTGNNPVAGSWYGPTAISQNGKYIAGQGGGFAPYLYTASGLNTGSSAVINTSSLGGDAWTTAVNNNGWVGGGTDGDTYDFDGRGWLYDGSTLHNSDIQTMINSVSSGYTFCGVLGITDATNPQLLVWGRDPTNIIESFLLTPVPEPSTALLLAIAIVTLSTNAWHSRRAAVSPLCARMRGTTGEGGNRHVRI